MIFQILVPLYDFYQDVQKSPISLPFYISPKLLKSMPYR